MYTLKTYYQRMLADTHTPVSVYMKLRDRFPNSILLESSDYHANDNSFSYICCNPIAILKVENNNILLQWPDHQEKIEINKETNIPAILDDFAKSFKLEELPFKFVTSGLFGYMAYDAVRYFENITIQKKNDTLGIPDIIYAVYQNIIAINHFKNEAYLFCHSLDNHSNLDELRQMLTMKSAASYPFRLQGNPLSRLSDYEYKEFVELTKSHCHRGDVFQLVLSRRFVQNFKGDEFNVYRALRSINPSPYLFYFDYGDFKIFGSSPEAQLVIKGRRAEIHPIAGTFRRTGQDEEDAELAKKLSEDPKENSEHTMLVDLARNDLSRNGHHVRVEKYREIQYFSHVIHLVSIVTSTIADGVSNLQVVADTFPAGTLSGAPKYRAMELIEQYEPESREYYGGAIGFIDFKGNFNHAIMIRTFLSKDYKLFYQAGAGIVAQSSSEAELEEVYNKISALKKAMEIAETI